MALHPHKTTNFPSSAKCIHDEEHDSPPHYLQCCDTTNCHLYSWCCNLEMPYTRLSVKGSTSLTDFWGQIHTILIYLSHTEICNKGWPQPLSKLRNNTGWEFRDAALMQAEEITLSSNTYRKNLQPHPAVMGTLLKLGEIQPLISSLCCKLISNFYDSVLGFFFLTAYTHSLGK